MISFWRFWSRLNKLHYTIAGSVSLTISLGLIPLALAFPPLWALVVGIPLFVGGVTLLFTKLSQFFLKQQNIQSIEPCVNTTENSDSNQQDKPVPSDKICSNKANEPSEGATPSAPMTFEVERSIPLPEIANKDESSEHRLPPPLPTTELVPLSSSNNKYIDVNLSDLHRSQQNNTVIHLSNVGSVFLKGNEIIIAYYGKNHDRFYSSFQNSFRQVLSIIEQHAKAQKIHPKDLSYKLAGQSRVIAQFIAPLKANKLGAEKITLVPLAFDSVKETRPKPSLRLTKHLSHAAPALSRGFFGQQLRVSNPAWPLLPHRELVRFNPLAQGLDDDDFIMINPSDFAASDIAGFSLEKVLQMCLFSKISYGDKDEQLHNKGYETIESLRNRGYTVIHFPNSGEPAGTVFLKGSTITIAYHGTKTFDNKLTDINVAFATSHFLPQEGRFHCGFYRSFRNSWPQVLSIIEQHARTLNIAPENLSYELTGHSMGGAIANIAALCIHKTITAENISVATFGAPRVFDDIASNIYKEALGKSTLRVTQHHRDPVPMLPNGLFGYAHAGQQLRITTQEGIFFHELNGYYQTLKQLTPLNFVSNNSVSLFFYTSKASKYMNACIIGYVHHALSSLVRGFFGHNDWSSHRSDKQGEAPSGPSI